MMKRKMTRRNFLKVAAAVSAAGVMSACGGDGMPPASSANGNTGNTGNEEQWKQLVRDHEELNYITPHYNSSALLATLSL